MIDEEQAAQAEGVALPAESAWHRAEYKADAVVDRVVAAIERWYEGHFHRAAVNGTAPLSSDDKAALIAHVSAAASTTQE